MNEVDPQGSTYDIAKPHVVDNSDTQADDNQRILGRQISTGSLRGTITVIGVNGQKISIGAIVNGGGFGISVIDSDGFLTYKQTGQTQYWYNKKDGKNIMQAGLLPNGTYGLVQVASGNDVKDLFP